MAITYEPLRSEDRRSVQGLAQSVYLEGECYAFAIALHQALGWPLVGVMKKEKIWHACVRGPRKGYFDVRGYVSYEDLGTPFRLKTPYELRDITEKDLFDTRPVQEMSIQRALWMAQVLWPDLPWRDGPKPKYTAFLAELEELCKKHGVYIFATLPTTLPVLTKRIGDEKGFRLTPSSTGENYFFNRVL